MKKFLFLTIIYLTKALIYGYKIVYKVDAENVRADQVLDDIDQAIYLEENAKNKAKYFHFKSFILKQLKEFEEALEAIEAALELDPKDFSINFMKYNIFYDDGKIDEALELVDEGIRLFPEKETKLMTHKAYLYKKKKNYDKGLEVLTEFGEYEEAVKILQKVLELDPLGWFTYNTYFQLARSYKELGNYDLARESLNSGIRATQTCFCSMEMRKEGKEKKQKILAEIEELEAKS